MQSVVQGLVSRMFLRDGLLLCTVLSRPSHGLLLRSLWPSSICVANNTNKTFSNFAWSFITWRNLSNSRWFLNVLKEPKRAKCWNFFTYEKSTERAECIICKTNLKTPGSSTKGLNDHMKAKHLNFG